MAVAKVAVTLVPLLLLSKANGTILRRRTYQQSDEYANYPPLEICDDLIVQVTGIQIKCSTPRTFYYGSGVNRNSQTCNYGDKATTTVYFDVVEDLYDTNIYVVMSFYAGYGNEVLTATSPKNLKKYVGYEVQAAGSYSYTYATTLGSSGSGSGSFVPYIQIAFSSETNGGECNRPFLRRYDDSTNKSYSNTMHKIFEKTTISEQRTSPADGTIKSLENGPKSRQKAVNLQRMIFWWSTGY